MHESFWSFLELSCVISLFSVSLRCWQSCSLWFNELEIIYWISSIFIWVLAQQTLLNLDDSIATMLMIKYDTESSLSLSWACFRKSYLDQEFRESFQYLSFSRIRANSKSSNKFRKFFSIALWLRFKVERASADYYVQLWLMLTWAEIVISLLCSTSVRHSERVSSDMFYVRR